MVAPASRPLTHPRPVARTCVVHLRPFGAVTVTTRRVDAPSERASHSHGPDGVCATSIRGTDDATATARVASDAVESPHATAVTTLKAAAMTHTKRSDRLIRDHLVPFDATATRGA